MMQQKISIYKCTRFLSFLFFGSISLLLNSCSEIQTADLIVHNAEVYTVDSAFSKVQAFAVVKGMIVATGSDQDILGSFTSDNMVDAGGRPVYPGFIDAHAHFVGYGRSLYEVNLYDCNSWEEALERVVDFRKTHPDEPWVRGRGWDQNKFPGGQYPDNAKLNKLFPDVPVLLRRVDGHAAIANQVALTGAGINAATRLPGGEIAVAGGHVTGLLIDNAVDLVVDIIPKANMEVYKKWLTTAQRNCFAQGLTTVADCGLKYHEVTKIDTLQREGALQMRMYVMLSDDTSTYKDYTKARMNAMLSSNSEASKYYYGNGPYKTDRLYVKGVKAYADGALGSRGACLLKHYADKPDWHGFLLSSQSHFDSLAQVLALTDFQLCTHAIGDSGNRMILNVYKKYLGGKNDKRWRIEHAQVVSPEDFHLFGENNVVPSVQPTHATSDMYWAGDRLGEERLKSAYAYQELLQQNGWLPLGTDFPVEDISPIKTFYAAVVRKDAKGFPDGGFQAENALTREQAIRGMTTWAAKACFLEDEVGSIKPGMKADFVILDTDLMKCADEEILGTKVSDTYIGGLQQ